ncbi:MAG: right-handed parallel beta-helix repeat-containing protein [Spirochaetales bacterium]|nr:right-handed parallel beta-helix repeat-containing protein [Spirochaetales bacterium]
MKERKIFKELQKIIVCFFLCFTLPATAQDLGDVNGDWNIDIVDALLTAQYYVGLNPGNFNPGNADVNCDNSIDIVDALLIAQYYVGLIPAMPCSATNPPTPTPTNPPSGIVYAAPYGSSGAPGTENEPTTLRDALLLVQPGGMIYLRGGTYTYSETILIEPANSGSPGKTKSIVAYSGETPVLNFSAMAENSSNRGLQVNGNYWYIKGIIAEEAGDNGIFIGGDNNTVERCITRRNHDTGLQLGRYDSSFSSINDWPSNNLILQCESHDNADSDNEDADGFAAKLTSGTGNTFRGCISHNNIDDGWDLYTKTDTGSIGPVTLEYCIAYGNGTLTNGSTSGNGDKNGFKLGGEDIAVNHTVKYCIAFNNGKHGFTYNRNTGSMQIVNCASFYSAERNFNFDGGSSTFINNLSYESGDTDRIIGSALNPAYNCWWDDQNGTINPSGLNVTSADFVSLAIGSISYNADGTLNYGNFLALAPGSDLVGAGMSGGNIGAR